ncbi:hypothetical protein BW730_03215 [Tessaracoccus aquimaris]|uniref:Endonuclease/exonuclease/phosphatase domain-containing protein n=1 Tax=Tessaracoccus aquimaris TaxID=1332264 RepID=A0A1Q2CKP9_9ACTN|nr:endonuclease/exonuclease/phosphatase family protein [Tessaracoccus aquimaris]AQP46684.1 hypothetical protein BW730_03215 [Tessaracoccus aquimaris]
MWRSPLLVVGWVTVGTLATLWVLAATPLRSVEGVAPLVAPDRVAALIALTVALLSGLAARRMGPARRRLVVLLVASLLVCGLFVGRVLVQGTHSVVPAHGEPTLRVLSWNAAGVHPADIAQRFHEVAVRRDVDVLVLPETGDEIARMVSDRLDLLGWDHAMFEDGATSVFVRDALATEAGYVLLPGNPPWAGITVKPRRASAETPFIVAVHVQQPSPGNVAVRDEHLAWVESLCAGSDFVLAVGDFNSTPNHLDSGRLGRCADVALAVEAGAASTWPTWLPSWLGISIDRAMVGPPYEPGTFGFEVLRSVDTGGPGLGSDDGADHWPILIEVTAP